MICLRFSKSYKLYIIYSYRSTKVVLRSLSLIWPSLLCWVHEETLAPGCWYLWGFREGVLSSFPEWVGMRVGRLLGSWVNKYQCSPRNSSLPGDTHFLADTGLLGRSKNMSGCPHVSLGTNRNITPFFPVQCLLPKFYRWGLTSAPWWFLVNERGPSCAVSSGQVVLWLSRVDERCSHLK